MDVFLTNFKVDFGSISHATGTLTYLLATVLLARSYLRRNTDRALLLACAFTSLWLGALTLQAMTDQPPFYIRYALEVIRNASWLIVLFLVLGVGLTPTRSAYRTQYWISLLACALLLFLFLAGFVRGVFDLTLVHGRFLLVSQISLSLCGMVLLEQIWRNAAGYNRSNIRYLATAIGALFAYDFFLYSDALLFNQVSTALWDARGAVNALVAPLIGLTLVNSRRQPIEVQVSRQLVFHTSALLVAGLYLLVMSVGGYYIKFFGGSWSAGLQVLFFFGALVFFVVLVSSNKLRARLMVFISQHFFNYKYDYREEWLKITRMLTATDSDEALTDRVIRVLMSVVKCNAGALWVKDEDNNFTVLASINLPGIRLPDLEPSSSLIEYMSESDWIIDLHEHQLNPKAYRSLTIPDGIWSAEKPWLIVPLFLKDELYGCVLIASPLTPVELNWENYDMIKIVARQACSYLALSQAQERLAEAKQFEAVSRTSAFMIHDLKTMIAQLSLLTKNASRHKTNPAFVDDMVRTTEHTVNKMNHLLQQIHNPTKQVDEDRQIDLTKLIRAVIESHAKNLPIPTMNHPPQFPIMVRADPEMLSTVIGHIVQNAQDATQKHGRIQVSIILNGAFAEIQIEDNGCGMSEEFIKYQLFKPFESTKGLVGMGIGAYQCREYLRRIGGGIEVTSQLGVGTRFTLKVPVVHAAPRAEALSI